MNQTSRYSGILNEQIDLALKAYPHYEKLRKKLAGVFKSYRKNYLKHEPGVYAVEIGCGSGNTTRYVLEVINPKTDALYAVDNDPQAIKRLEERFIDDRVGFREELLPIVKDAYSYLSIPEDKSDFHRSLLAQDIIFSSWVLHNFDRTYKNKVLVASYNRLKPNGAFISLDKIGLDDRVKDEKLFQKQIARINKTLSGYPELRAALIKHEYEDMTPEFILREAEFLAQMRQIGFRNCRIAKRIERDAILVAEK